MVALLYKKYERKVIFAIFILERILCHLSFRVSLHFGSVGVVRKLKISPRIALAEGNYLLMFKYHFLWWC